MACQAHVSKEVSPILVTRFLGNEWWNVGRKTFVSLSETPTKSTIRKKYRLLQSFFCYTQMQKRTFFFSSKVFDRFYPLKHNRKKVAMETSSTSGIWIWVWFHSIMISCHWNTRKHSRWVRIICFILGF